MANGMEILKSKLSDLVGSYPLRLGVGTVAAMAENLETIDAFTKEFNDVVKDAVNDQLSMSSEEESRHVRKSLLTYAWDVYDNHVPANLNFTKAGRIVE